MGVVVGTCAIIVMVSLGLAVNQQTEQLLDSWGDLTMIEVSERREESGFTTLDQLAVQEIQNNPYVLAASPIVNLTTTQGTITTGNRDQFSLDLLGNIIGIEPNSISKLGYKLLSGDLFSGEHFGRRSIPVFASRLAAFSFSDTRKSYNHPDYMRSAYDESGEINLDRAFFNLDNSRLTLKLTKKNDGGEITVLKEYELVIVGVLSETTSGGIPINSFIMSNEDIERLETEYVQLAGNENLSQSSLLTRGIEGQSNGYDSVLVKVDSIDHMDDLETLLHGRGYNTYSMTAMRKEMQSRVVQGQLTLGGLALVSMLIAALNIANTTTMSINERTKEIGIMKVLGCEIRSIKALFLFESALIGFVGGIVGCTLALGVSVALNSLPTIIAAGGSTSGNEMEILSLFGLSDLAAFSDATKLSIIPWWLLFFALLFSTVVGLISGALPSQKATKITSLEALRHE